MFSLVRHYPFFRKIVLLLFLLPLMFSGGSFLGGLAQQQTVGEVGSLSIPREEFISYYQRLAEYYRSNYGVEELSPKLQQEVSEQTQSELLSRYLLRTSIERKGVFAPDSAVAAAIRKVSDFQDEDGNFSSDLYRRSVSDHRRYHRLVRQSVNNTPLFTAFNALPVNLVRTKLAAFRRQQRVVDEAVISVDSLAATITLDVTEEDINFYYQKNANRYALREEADFEYFVVSLNTYAINQTVSEDDARAEYDNYVAEGDIFQRRQVSHIYIGDNEQADELYERAAAGENFAELAQTHSEDAGSADVGGDLGIVAVGDLPPEMEDVIFALTVGEISPPVELEDGYSILKLDDIITEEISSFADLQEEMKLRAQRIAAADEFEAAVEDLGSRTAEEIGSLQSLAATAETEVVTITAVQRDPRNNDFPFNDEVAIEDAFESFVVEDGENSNPIPLGEDAYLFVRSTRYQQAGITPLEEVTEEINGILRARAMINILYRQLEQAREGDDITGIAALDNVAPPIAETDKRITLAADADAATANENDIATTTATVSATDEDETTTASLVVEEDILTRLENTEWEVTHTVLLANVSENENTESGLDSIDADANNDNGGSRGATGANTGGNREELNEEGEAVLTNRSINLIFTADLSQGLPAYTFEPLENEIRIFRIREKTENEPQEEDFLVIDELFAEAVENLSSSGYLTALSQQHNFEFYDLPELGIINAQQ